MMEMDSFDWLEFEAITPSSAAAQKKPGARPNLQRAPHDAPTFYQAARNMREAGHFKAAADCYARAFGFDDQHFRARLEYIDTLIRAGRVDMADRASRESLEQYKQTRVFYASRALVLAHQGRLAEAYPLSDVSLEGDTVSWYAHAVRAELLLLQSRAHLDTALEQLEAATETAPARWEPLFIGGWALLHAGIPAGAAGFFSEAVHVKPRAVLGLLCLGDCFRELRLYDQAMFYYQKAAELEPTHEVALDRQRKCTPLRYGLLRIFRRRGGLQERWNREFKALEKKWEPTIDDF